jgi:hypothetical protein
MLGMLAGNNVEYEGGVNGSDPHIASEFRTTQAPRPVGYIHKVF